METAGCYTVATALYKVSDNMYVYFDGSNWDAMDSLETLNGKGLTYDKTSGNITYSGNYIMVWPSNSEVAKNDSASVPNNQRADTKISDDKNKASITSTETPSTIVPGVTVRFEVGDKIGKYAPFEFSSGGSKKYFSSPLEDGELINHVDNHIDNADDIHFVMSELKWRWYNEETGSSQEGTVEELREYLNGYYGNPFDPNKVDRSITVNAKGIVPERTVDIPVVFEALNNKLNVNVITDGASDNTIEMTYHMAQETIDSEVTGFDSSNLQVTVSDDYDSDLVKFDRSWAVKLVDNTDYEKDGSGDYTFVPDANILSTITSDVDSYIENASDKAEAVNKLETKGFKFVAAADIYKKVYVRGILDENYDFKGKVKFGSDMQDMFAETYAQNDLSKSVYEATGSGAGLSKSGNAVYADGNISGGYSIFSGHELYVVSGEEATIFESSKAKVRFWKLFDSEFSYELEDTGNLSNQENNREQYNCTKEIIEKLYGESNGNYGEVAEVDVSGSTTKIDNKVSAMTSIRSDFLDLVKNKNASYINSINYVSGTSIPTASEVFAEKCISVTPVVKGQNGKLERMEDGSKYKVNEEDRVDDYPAYTVAYSKKISDTSYDIYVVTEDGTDMLVEGSLKGMNKDFSNMTVNTVVSHYELESTVNMSEMFSGCKKLTQLDLSNLNTTGVTSMNNMFYNCNAITSINVGGFDTTAVTTMASMFENCNVLTGTLDLSSFETSNVTTMASMFSGCSNLETLKLDRTKFTASTAITTVNKMFNACNKLSGLDLRGFGTCPALTDIGYWFSRCYKLKYIDLSNFSPGTLTNISNAFDHVGMNSYAGTDYTDIKANDGCAVFAKEKWNCKDGITDGNKFSYMRTILYGKTFKNSNSISNITFKNDKTGATVKITITDGSVDHLTPLKYDEIYSTDNSQKDARISTYPDLPTGVRRAATGYFNDAESDYYSSYSWAPAGYND